MKTRGNGLLAGVASIAALLAGCDHLPVMCGVGASGGGRSGTGGMAGAGGRATGGAGGRAGMGGMAGAGGRATGGGGGRAGMGGIAGTGGLSTGGGGGPAGTGGTSTGGAGGTSTGGAGGSGGAPAACTAGSFAHETLTFTAARGNPDYLPFWLAARSDAAGRIHLVWNGRMPNQILYASKPSGLGWSPAFQVAENGNCAGPVDLVVAPSGIVDVLYSCGAAAQSLFHDRRTTDGTWQYSPNYDAVYRAPSTSASTQVFSSIEVDSSGAPLVAYSASESAQDGKLALTTKPTPTAPWESTDILPSGATRPFLVIDSTSRLHASFFDPSVTGGVKYATRAAGATAWTTEIVDAAGNATSPTPLAVGPDGVAHVLYSRADGVRHAVRGAGGTWTSELVSAMGTAGSFVITADARLRGLILVNGQATYVQRGAAGGAWTAAPPLGAAIGLGPRVLAVEPSGVVHAFFVSGDIVVGDLTKTHAFGCPAAP